MPAIILSCDLCGRDRRWSKLDMEFRIEDCLAVPYYKCRNGCLPTKREARRERKQQSKILSELKDWTEKTLGET